MSFGSKQLLERCSTLEAGQNWLGPADAQALIELLADAESAQNCAELIDLYDASCGNTEDSVSFAVGPRYRATFVAIGNRIARSPDGCPDWAKVIRLKLINVSRCQ